ncbi:MAG: LamG-like jellyroll fold domain-containing protein, partial [Planctomycetota bacterium]
MIARFKKNSYQWSPLAVILIIILSCVSLLDARRTKASGISAAKPPPTTESFDGEADAAALLNIEYTEPASHRGANITWVTSTRDYDFDGVQDDQGFIDWLVAEGHNVDVRIDYWKELDAAKVDELNAADLVIISRSVDGQDHDDGNETTVWNSVTTPLITMNCYLVRLNRWRWMNTIAHVSRDLIMRAVDPTHPVFDGVTLEGGNLVIFLDKTVGSGKATFVNSLDVGNGTLIAQTFSHHTWIAEWPAGVEFYAGSGQIAGGPRMLFTAGTQEQRAPDPLTAWGAWNLTVEGEKMFRNAINYMLAEPVGANITWVTSTRDYDLDGVQDDQGWIDWLTAEGHTVDVRIDYWNYLDLEPNKVDELNAADLVIISRSVGSGAHDDGNEPTLWNSVTTPLITMNCFLARSLRWRWMDTTTYAIGDYIMLVSDTSHPVFDGVTFEGDNMVICLDNTVGSGTSTFVGGIDVGNGTLIAQTLGPNLAWIAEWSTGVEFYAGSGQTAGGRRMLFTAGTQEQRAPDPLSAWGAFNLTAEGEQMFRNAIAYMLPAAPEAQGPVAHWQLDEGAGTIAADSSGNGLDGTLMGDPQWVAGIIGGALEFDGVDDYVDCGNPSILDFGTGDFAISAWIKTTDAGGETVFAKGGDQSGGIRYRLFVETTAVKILVDDDINKHDPQGDIPVLDGQWHHLVGMRVV